MPRPNLPKNLPPPRVLLSVDFEPWYAFIRRYDAIASDEERQILDGGFSKSAIDGVLQQLTGVKASFYLVGEIAEWYPEVPQKIVEAGHELGLHCQIHRPLVSVSELAEDIRASADWRSRYPVRGYRAPMVGISEDAYPLLKNEGFFYSSSMYAVAGMLLKKRGIWEVPVSTVRFMGNHVGDMHAPRDFSMKLLFNGEFPYGSSFTIGLMSDMVMRLLERDLKAGYSPVIILHPYELVPPPKFLRCTIPDLLKHPLLVPFVLNKTKFLARLLRTFPVSPLGAYLDEVLQLDETSHA
jgi:hypothetical protein